MWLSSIVDKRLKEYTQGLNYELFCKELSKLNEFTSKNNDLVTQNIKREIEKHIKGEIEQHIKGEIEQHIKKFFDEFYSLYEVMDKRERHYWLKERYGVDDKSLDKFEDVLKQNPDKEKLYQAFKEKLTEKIRNIHGEKIDRAIGSDNRSDEMEEQRNLGWIHVRVNLPKIVKLCKQFELSLNDQQRGELHSGVTEIMSHLVQDQTIPLAQKMVLFKTETGFSPLDNNPLLQSVEKFIQAESKLNSTNTLHKIEEFVKGLLSKILNKDLSAQAKSQAASKEISSLIASNASLEASLKDINAPSAGYSKPKSPKQSK